jgi:hypothetical protein
MEELLDGKQQSRTKVCGKDPLNIMGKLSIEEAMGLSS